VKAYGAAIPPAFCAAAGALIAKDDPWKGARNGAIVGAALDAAWYGMFFAATGEKFPRKPSVRKVAKWLKKNVVDITVVFNAFAMPGLLLI
jgi:hypothetical protein